MERITNLKGEIFTLIEFSVQNQKIVWPRDKYVIAGSVGHVSIKCSFDGDWDGLSKRFVFTNGDISKAVLITDDEAVLIPHEVLVKGKLFISIIGLSENGEKKLTTRKMVLPVVVLEAGAQGGEEPEVYTPELWEQVLSAIGDLASLKTNAKSDIVSAVNELAKGGGNGGGTGGADGEDGVGIDSITFKEASYNGNVYTVRLTDGRIYEITAPKGDTGIAGAKGDKGDDGIGISDITYKGKDSNGGNIYLVKLSDGSSYEIVAPKGEKGEAGAGGTGGDGTDGEDGATYTPFVSDDGVLSWTNDKGLPNPSPVNIKGDKGDTGAAGKDGTNGKDGVSVTHSWNGTKLTVTSASGTTTTDLKGDKGDKGETGPQGEKGDTGSQGPQGAKGDKGDTGATGPAGADGKNGTDGYSPVRGKDYWTASDIAEIKGYVDNAILGGAW